MRILVACEESQVVCSAFRSRGHEAYSCDVQPTSGDHPEWHILGDVRPLLSQSWDMIIAFPPCTYMTKASAVRMFPGKKLNLARYEKALAARDFFMLFYTADCSRVVIENPTPLKIVGLPAYDQVIQPYQFGHPYSKRTCLWLRGVDPLVPTDVVSEHEPYVNGGCKDAHGNYRRFQGRKERDPKMRSKTFLGIAAAMADQWG